MANWLIRSTKQYIPRQSPSKMAAQYGGSFVNGEGNAVSNATAIYQPDLSQVDGYPSKYWVVTGDTVFLMDQVARDAVDAAEANTEKESLSTNLDRVLRAVVSALNDGSFVPGSNYTNPQMKAIIKDKL